MIKKIKIVGSTAVFILLSLVLQCGSINEDTNSEAKKINGVSFVSPPRQIDSSDYGTPKAILKANALSIMPFGFVSDSSTQIIYNHPRQWWGEKAEGVIEMIQGGKKNGYRVMLKPQVWKRGGSYTGHHTYQTESDWLAFEKSYQSFILDYAKIADSLKVEFFCIGTEWETFVMKRTPFWVQLIAKVKDIYQGKITYAANWDEYKRVEFWSELDYIGVDAYFPASKAKTPKVAHQIDSLKSAKEALKKLSRQFDKKILFTEYGYRSRDYNAERPWESDRNGAVNLKAQSRAYLAFYQSLWEEDFVAGGFIWKWFPNHAKSGGLENNSFTPQNKPVEKIIARFYSKGT